MRQDLLDKFFGKDWVNNEASTLNQFTFTESVGQVISIRTLTGQQIVIEYNYIILI